MPKKAGILFVIAGAVLILTALLFFFYNRSENHHAEQEAELLLAEVKTAIEQTEPEKPVAIYETEIVEPDFSEPTLQEVPEEPAQEETVSMGSSMPYDVIGYLSIPDLGLELPVISEWDYDRLKIAPCRHVGSVETDDLVIAAHNYKSHFGRLSTLPIGAQVGFTDMNGTEHCYYLTAMDTISPEDVDAVLSSGHDLTLYTCTAGRANRVTAFFDRADQN